MPKYIVLEVVRLTHVLAKPYLTGVAFSRQIAVVLIGLSQRKELDKFQCIEIHEDANTLTPCIHERKHDPRA